jgi:hypothetical protein
MKKRFSPRQVQKNKVTYTFDAFLTDLWKDVESTLPKEYFNKISNKELQNDKYKETLRDVFIFVYELCYMAVINHPALVSMLEKADDKKKAIVHKTLESNKENIALLRAIFLREIAKRLKQGSTKRQAVKATIEESKSVFINWIK